MKNFSRRKFLVLPFLLALHFALTAAPAAASPQKRALQWFPFYWQGDTISGQYIERAYLYIPVRIEGIPDAFSMQLDLGTTQTQFYGNSLKPYLNDYPALAAKLGPFVRARNAIFRNVDLRLGKVGMQIDVWHRANFGEKLSGDAILSDEPVHIGTIAADIFQDKVLMIDYKSRRIAVADNLPDKYKKLPAGEFELDKGIIKLPFWIDGKSCRLMLDTGSSPFPLATSKERALEISDPVVADSLSGPLWWGRDITFYGLQVNKPVELGGKRLKIGMVYYDKEGLWNEVYTSLDVWGLAGNAYFFDRMLILDYKNRQFRIK